MLQSAVNALGSTYVAAVAAGSKLYQLLGCPFDAMGATMATYCGQNVGARQLDRLGKGIRACALLGAVCSILSFAGMLLFSRPCAMLFLDPAEPQLQLLVSLTSQYVITCSAFFFPLSLVNIIRFSIQGMGYSTFAIFSGVLEMIARAGVAFFLVPRLGYSAACFASPAAWICADAFLIPASLQCIRRLRRKFPVPPAVAASAPRRNREAPPANA